MSTLNSPGVQVQVIDESFYTSAAPGTVPLIIVASHANKANGSSTGIAPGTLAINAGKVYLLSSQRELSDTFGTPLFQTDANNTAIHAGELNEYGLQAAHSFLGVSSRAYVVRADIDLSQLNATATVPHGDPENGTFWLDTANTKFGISQWNSTAADVFGGQSFTNQEPLVITDSSQVVDQNTYQPKSSIGAVGSYAMVAVTNVNKLWFKKPVATNNNLVQWVVVGSDEWKTTWPTVVGTKANPDFAANTIIKINEYDVTLGTTSTLDTLVAAINANNSLTAINIKAKKSATNCLELYAPIDIVIAGNAATAVGLTVRPYKCPSLTISKHTSVPDYKALGENRPSGSIWIKTTNPNLGADWKVNEYSTTTNSWVVKPAPLYQGGCAALAELDSAGGINLPVNAIYVKYEAASAIFTMYRRRASGPTTIISNIIESSTFTGSPLFSISHSIARNAIPSTPAAIAFTIGTSVQATIENLLSAINTAVSPLIVAERTDTNRITIRHLSGGDIYFTDVSAGLGALFSAATNWYVTSTTDKKYTASLWTATPDNNVINGFAIAQPDAPVTVANNEQLWYNSIVDEVDIMYNDGAAWKGYGTVDFGSGGGKTDKNGPIVSATKPTTQSDGVTPLSNGDLWISTADLENFPHIYKCMMISGKASWTLLDNADQTTENGIVFHDARWSTTGGTATAQTNSTIAELLMSDFVDFDAPDPVLYPKGMLLWNLRRSGFNVKKFVTNYIDVYSHNTRLTSDPIMTNYYPHRWISEAANQENGAGTFGRHAQRAVVLQSLVALINSNQQIRDTDRLVFNLLATPGYPEIIKPMVALNYDRGISAFVVGDTPARLTPDATTLSNWGKNTYNAFNDGDTGLVTTDAYLGMFYPWGYTTDLLGNNIVVPPSYIMLRTIALSDNASYPWFAPAGTRRGGITNASSVGFVDANGEFQSIALNVGQRDTLADIHVNPLTYISGTGLVNYGQYTRQLVASSLDRINVARLVIYLRYQLNQLAKPYLFEPNDTITRNEIRNAANSMMLELVGQRAIYDFLVVCDASNNTPDRIDRSELYLDIAISPVKAVEFIYIPLRLKNTGEISGIG